MRNLRLLLAQQCSVAIENAMGMLGIEMPERECNDFIACVIQATG